MSIVLLLDNDGTVAVNGSQSTCMRLAVIGVDVVADRSVGLMRWSVCC